MTLTYSSKTYNVSTPKMSPMDRFLSYLPVNSLCTDVKLPVITGNFTSVHRLARQLKF